MLQRATSLMISEVNKNGILIFFQFEEFFLNPFLQFLLVQQFQNR